VAARLHACCRERGRGFSTCGATPLGAAHAPGPDVRGCRRGIRSLGCRRRCAILAALGGIRRPRGMGSPSLVRQVDSVDPRLGGAAGRRHAQKPVRLVDAGRRHSDRAANSQVPPAPSMPPAGCVAARVTAQSSMPPTRCVAARITAQSSMPPAGCGIAPTLEPSGPRSITPRPTPPAAAGGGERRRESTAGARGPCGPQPPSAAETRLPRGRTRSRGGCGSRHRRPA